MESLEFYKAIEEIPVDPFYLSLQGQLLQSDNDEMVKMTQMSILFEGYYRYTSDQDERKSLSTIRALRWKQHYGTPTIEFLLTWQDAITKTSDFFLHPTETLPWLIPTDCIQDGVNNVLYNPESVSQIETPEKEANGFFTKTHNPQGGYVALCGDPISEQFIAQKGKRFLEIGAGLGETTLGALSKGAEVFCNDIEPKNLAVVQNRYLKILGKDLTNLSNLKLLPGAFPEELQALPKHYFDGILLCRVLHFFKGSKIEESLSFLAELLIPKGKLYIVCETPYLKNWQKFIPEFQRRLENKIKWPGEINEPHQYESSGRMGSLPPFVHWIDKETLIQALDPDKFEVELATYIDRTDTFPEDLVYQGRESVGIIGVRL